MNEPQPLQAPVQVAPRRGWLHLLLLLATIATTFGTFLFMWGGGVAGPNLLKALAEGTLRADLTADQLAGSAMFALSALLILGAHEMGHYVMARVHRVDVTLPYFIPVPLLGFGTMGAVIRLKGRVPSRNALVDIGAAGPLAGLMIALPLLVVGMMASHVGPAPAMSEPFPPNLSLWSLAGLAGKAANAWYYDKAFAAPWGDMQLFGDNLLTLLVQRLVHGKLTAGQEVYAHPVFIAAWFGLLVTMLNLIPVGQLDGGHLTHAWFGERAERLGKLVAQVLLVLALIFSASWLVWFFIVTKLVGFRHPPVIHTEEPLSRGRKAVCVVAFVFTVLTVMPMPLGIL